MLAAEGFCHSNMCLFRAFAKTDAAVSVSATRLSHSHLTI